MPFCCNCGAKLPDDAKFCSNCGAAAGVSTASSATSDASAQNVQPLEIKPAKKNRTALIIICAVLIFAVVAVSAFFIGKGNADSDNESAEINAEPPAEAAVAVNPFMPADDSNESAEAENEPSSDESYTESVFDTVFNDYGLTYTAADFDGLDCAAYVADFVDNDVLYIDCMEYGYSNNLVYEMVETVYYYVGVLTDSELEEVDAAMRGAFAAIEAQPFVELSYDSYSTWYVITLKIHDLGKVENVKAAIENGVLIGDENISYISMSDSEEELISNGYCKR